MNSTKTVLADALPAHNTVERTIKFSAFGVESGSRSLLKVKLEKNILEGILSARSRA